MSFVITDTFQAKKNIDRANVYLNGKFWIGISKNDLLLHNLIKGRELSEIEKHDVEKTVFNSKLINKAFAYIQLRPRSTAEVRDYLVLKKKVSEEDAQNVISYLKDHNFLSDEEFAEWFINYKTSSGINGVNKIKAELIKKGVDRKIIGSLLENISKDEEFLNNQKEKIEQFINKVRPTIKAKDSYELKTKLIQKLLARGFKYDDIKKIVK